MAVVQFNDGITYDVYANTEICTNTRYAASSEHTYGTGLVQAHRSRTHTSNQITQPHKLDFFYFFCFLSLYSLYIQSRRRVVISLYFFFFSFIALDLQLERDCMWKRQYLMFVVIFSDSVDCVSATTLNRKAMAVACAVANSLCRYIQHRTVWM